MDYHRHECPRGSIGGRPDGLVLGLWQGAEYALEPRQANGLRQGESHFSVAVRAECSFAFL